MFRGLVLSGLEAGVVLWDVGSGELFLEFWGGVGYRIPGLGFSTVFLGFRV